MKTYFLLVLCVLFWAGNFVLGRFIHEQIEPLELAFFRWLLTFLVLIPILITRRKQIFLNIKQHFFILLFLSFLGITAYNTLVYVALTMTTSTNALIINSSVPILILVFSTIILHQKINFLQIFGIGLSTLGVIFLVLQGDFSNIFLLQFNSGDLIILITSISWALYSVFVKFRPKALSNIEFFTTIVFLGFVLLLPFYFSQGYSLEKEILLFKSNYLIFFYISLFASCLSFYFWHYAIDTIGASKTGQFVHLMPVFGITLATIFLDEKLVGYHFFGITLIGLGIYLCLFYVRKKST